jgi:hypothetical protein
MFLHRYTLKDGEMVEDKEGDWCRLDFVEHLVNNLQQELVLLDSNRRLMELELERL